MGTMLDTTDDPRRTFSGLPVEAVAAYGNGRYANYPAAKAEFPDAHILEIDVSGAGIGNAGDFEPGDMAYSRAGSWAKQRIKAGVRRPVIYFSVANWRAILQSLKTAGVSREDVRLWTAHYNGRAHVCSSACGPFGVTGTADATQWGSSDAHGTLPRPYAGRNVDVSMTVDDFWMTTAPPPVEVPPFPGRNLHQPPVMSGHGVKTWQAQMARRGWTITADDAYGPASAAVCRKFQAEHHLTVDGIVGPATWKAAWA